MQHKEKIKKLKENVDVLTLTATPIPRTLHMSLIGIRDMSVLEEAPEERLPIQTYVMEYNDEMVREAIERECARQGQVYYVYNRVEDIAEVTARIQKLVPDVTVAYRPRPDAGASSWNGSCTTLSTGRSMCWCLPPSLRRALTSPM